MKWLTILGLSLAAAIVSRIADNPPTTHPIALAAWLFGATAFWFLVLATANAAIQLGRLIWHRLRHGQ